MDMVTVKVLHCSSGSGRVRRTLEWCCPCGWISAGSDLASEDWLHLGVVASTWADPAAWANPAAWAKGSYSRCWRRIIARWANSPWWTANIIVPLLHIVLRSVSSLVGHHEPQESVSRIGECVCQCGHHLPDVAQLLVPRCCVSRLSSASAMDIPAVAFVVTLHSIHTIRLVHQ